MWKTLVFAALLGVTFAQERPCVAPPYFQTKMLAYDHLTNFYRSGEFYYDAYGERIRLVVKVAANETMPTQETLVLHREKKEFIVDLRTGKCTKTAPKYEFQRIESNEGYHFVERVGVGSLPSDGVELDVWYKNENTADMQGVSIMEFTSKDCIPFYYAFEGMINQEKVHYRREFYNVVTQVEDLNIFDIPKTCLE